MLAIISATLATEPNSHFTLIYGNRSSQSMMFRRALADLKDKYPQRLQLLSIFSRERLDSDLLYGRIDGEKLQALAKTLINFRQYDEAFICGPSAMMDDAEATLKALGMPDKSIHLERFNTSGITVKRAAHVQAEGQKVTVRRDGRDREITLTADDESILDAALRQGRICRMPARAASAPPVNAKCCAGRWTWRPTTARSRTSWPPGMC